MLEQVSAVHFAGTLPVCFREIFFVVSFPFFPFPFLFFVPLTLFFLPFFPFPFFPFLPLTLFLLPVFPFNFLSSFLPFSFPDLFPFFPFLLHFFPLHFFFPFFSLVSLFPTPADLTSLDIDASSKWKSLNLNIWLSCYLTFRFFCWKLLEEEEKGDGK